MILSKADIMHITPNTCSTVITATFVIAIWQDLGMCVSVTKGQDGRYYVLHRIDNVDYDEAEAVCDENGKCHIYM